MAPRPPPAQPPALIATVNDLSTVGVDFKSLTEGIDTTTPSGRLTFHLFGALAEFERESSSENALLRASPRPALAVVAVAGPER